MPVKYSVVIYKSAWFAAVLSVLVWTEAVFATCNIVTNGLVGCYSFENDFKDGSVNGNNGTSAGGVSFVKGKVGQAAKLNGGATGYVRIPNPAQKFDREYTISAWVSTAGRGQSILSKYSWNTTRGLGFNAWFSTPGATDAFGFSGSTLFGLTVLDSTSSTFPSYTLPVNQFKYVTIIYNTGKTKIYIDGKFTVENSIAHSSSLENPYDMLIGNYFYNNGTIPISNPHGRTFDGLIDELRVYNRAITDAEITQLFNEGNAPCVPATYNGNTGTLQVPFIAVEGASTAYKTTFQQFASSFAFRIAQNTVASGSNSCPANYSLTTGVLHIPIVKTTLTLVPSVSQCYDVTMQAFSSRFQLDLENLKVIPCP